jgi:hypothetical protein
MAQECGQAAGRKRWRVTRRRSPEAERAGDLHLSFGARNTIFRWFSRGFELVRAVATREGLGRPSRQAIHALVSASAVTSTPCSIPSPVRRVVHRRSAAAYNRRRATPKDTGAGEQVFRARRNVAYLSDRPGRGSAAGPGGGGLKLPRSGADGAVSRTAVASPCAMSRVVIDDQRYDQLLQKPCAARDCAGACAGL